MEYAVHRVANFLPSGASGSAVTMAVLPSAPAASSLADSATSCSVERVTLARTTCTPAECKLDRGCG